MKILLFIALLFPAYSFAQDFSNRELGKTQKEVVEGENLLIRLNENPKSFFKIELVVSSKNSIGGVTLTYRHTVHIDNKDVDSFEEYMFDSDDKLIKDVVILHTTDELEQVNYMVNSFGYYKVNSNLLYHRTSDVKVKIENTSIEGTDWAMFIYSRKNTQ